MKKIQVNLQVQADIAAAQRNIQSLAQLLNQIGSKPISVDSGPLREAQEAAQQLQVHLQNAVNVNTGKLNLVALNTSLKQSGASLVDLTKKLQYAGTEGQQAFVKVAKTVASAEAPIYQMNSTLKKLGVTLLNTVKWQISSSVIHGISGAIGDVIHNAKDLNKAFNDIQIVTGYTSDKMLEVANSARKAAQELNTTTAEYSKAALIFYQQGLSGSAVEERTNTVIRLAQVTGQSAETVSSQMTAIWNNFDNGSHKLEYYADVITALGAATASSSAEISDGLQKFAAVADTVGLSYEKAAASLATVVAETRQSPEVVGTAFKTIFARIEGLRLGEKLEDGVDLNKYSEALKTIGVDILDANGNLESMDKTLDKLGNQWALLGESQKVALAQTVAGVRQYNQFIAEMENYNKILANQNLAKNSAGTLEKQAETWSKSWAAASERVKQTQSELYSSILNDNALIGLEDMFNGVLKGLQNVIDASGGFLPLIGLVLGSFSNILLPQLINGFGRIKNHISILRGSAISSMEEVQNSFISTLDDMLSKENNWSDTTKKQIQLTLELSQAKQKLAIASKNMSEAQKAEAQSRMAVYEAQVQSVQELLQEQQELENTINKLKEKIEFQSKKDINAAAGMHAFKQDHQEDDNKISNSEMNRIEEDATSTNIRTTQKRINEIEKDNKVLNNIDNEISSAESAYKTSQDTYNENLAAGVSKDDEQMKSIYESIEKYEEKIIKLKEKRTNREAELEANKEELEHLKLVEEAQKRINEQKGKDVNSQVVGSIEGFDTFESQGRTGESQKYGDSMRESFSKSMGVEKDPNGDGSMVLESSVENLEKLCNQYVKYEQLLQEVKEIEGTFNIEMKEYNAAIEEKTQLEQEAAQNTQALEDAENALGDAEKELKAAKEEVLRIEKEEGKNLKNNSKASDSYKEAIQRREQAEKKVAKALKEKNDASKKSEQTQKKVEQSEKRVTAATEKSKAAIEEFKNSMTAVAEKSGLSGTALDNFKGKLNSINPEEASKGLKSILDPFIEGLQNADQETIEFIQNMRNQLENSGIDVKILDDLIDKLVRTGQISQDVANKLKGIKVPDDKVSGVSKLTTGLSKLASGAARVGMAIQAIKSLGQIFSDEDADPIEKITTLLMSLSMILPVINAAMKIGSAIQLVATAVKKKDTEETKKSTKEKIKETAATTGATLAEKLHTAALIVKSAVQKHGYIGAAIGLGVAAATVAGLVALTASLNKSSQAEKEMVEQQQQANEEAQKSAKNALELAKKWQEESNKMDTLIKKYKELKDAGKDVTEVQQDILKQAPDLIKAYKEMNEKFKFSGGPDLTEDIQQLEYAVAAGDTTTAMALKNIIDQKASSATVTEVQKGSAVASSNLQTEILKTNYGQDIGRNKEEKTLYDTAARISSSSGVKSLFSEYSNFYDKSLEGKEIILDFDDDTGGDSEKDKTQRELTRKLKDKIKKYIDENSLNLDFLDNGTESNEENMLIGLDNSSEEGLHKSYSDMLKLQEFLASDAEIGSQLGSMTAYQQIADFISNTKDKFTDFQGYIEGKEQYQVEDAALSNNIDITNIKDFSDYEKTMEDLRLAMAKKLYEVEDYNELTEAQKKLIEQQVDTWAKGKTILTDYVKTADKFNYIESRYGKEVREKFHTQYEQLNSKDKKLFLEIEFSRVATEEAFDAEIGYLRNKSKKEKISSNLTSVQEATEALKETGMSSDDWAKIANLNWEDIKEKTGVQYIDFLKMTYDAQKQFLINLGHDWGTELPSVIQRGIYEASNYIDDFKEKHPEVEGNENKIDEVLSNYHKAIDSLTFISEEVDENGKNIVLKGEQAYQAYQQIAKDENYDYLNDQSKGRGNEKDAKDIIAAVDAASQNDLNISTAELAQYDFQKKNLKEQENQLAISIRSSLINVKSLQELNKQVIDLTSQGFDLSEYHESIASSLINLGNQYENCSDEVLKFQQALLSGSEELKTEAEIILRNSIAIGEMSKSLNLESKNVEEQAKELRVVNNLSKENYAIANKVALLNQSMNKGLKELVDNWDEYKKTLTSAQKGTQAYAEAALKTKEALAQMLGVLNVDHIPDNFFDLPETMSLIDSAVKGDISAINKLGASMAKATIEALEWKEGMETSTDSKNFFKIDESTFKSYKQEVLEGIQELTEGIQNGTIKAGQDITKLMDGTGETWIKSLNQMAQATNMSVEQMNSMLNELGIDADVEYMDKTLETEVPEYTTYEKTISEKEQEDDVDAKDGFKPIKSTFTKQSGTRKVHGSIQVAQINMGDKNKGKKPTIKYAGRDNPSSAALTKTESSSGSSGSSSSNTKAASHSHEVNRYSNEENAVKGLTKEYEKLGKVKDQAFGKGRIYAMEQELKALKELKQASGDYLDAVAGKGNADKVAKAIYSGKNIGSMISSGQLGGTIKADYNSLYGGLSASGKRLEYTAKDSDGNEWLASDNYSLSGFNSLFGTNLQFSLDSFGNIQNKDSILNLLQNLKNNENDAYSRAANPTASSTTEYNKRIAYLDEIKSRIDQYGQTANLLTEKSNAYLEYISSIQEKNAEIISAKMENGVNLSQKTIQRLERAIKVLGDNIYKTAEAMQSWFNSNFKEGVDADKQKGDSAVEAIDEIEKRVKLYEENPLDENALSPAKAAELLSSTEDTLDGVVDSLLSRIQSGKEYYGQVLDYWNNKLEAVNRSIENNIKVFDHLQNILSLLGRSTDYEAIGNILQGKFEASQEDYLSKKAQATIAKQAYEQAKQNRENLIAEGISAEALEVYDENVLQKALDDYQTKADAMYTSLEETIELSNQLFENEMNKIMQESEDRLTGEWGNFSDLDSAMKRQQSISDEYLTKTNQIYETNSLLRKLSQDIDKNDSQIAKSKLKAFSDEITAMQAQEKLSKTDLEIAKARYEVLKAQIALEEAQNAKSTVRLQRDNEGNYGYVYTADQEKTADAEQNLADKQNDLYNLLLTQAETYGQKSIEMRKEWQAEMQALVEQYQNDTSMSEEEFLMKQADINNKYREMEIAYQESFQTANTWLNQVGAEGQTEAWINSFDTVITQHRIFNDDSINELNGYNNEINSVADDVTNTINDKFQELKEQRDFFTEESKTGNKELQGSIDEVTSSVSQLSKNVTGKNGLADSMSNAMNKAQNLTTAFINQYDALQQLITKYSSAADEANKLYNRTADLVNVQVALNHANRGATSVSWGPGGVTAYYGSNSNGGNGNDSSDGIGSSGSSSYKQRYAVHDYVTGKDIVVTEDQIEQYRLKGAGPSRYLIKKISQYGTPGHFKSGGYTGIWVSGKTGMYTGSWNGPDIEENGKLAFLHQKELVLNADDTENMLSAVKLIRQISQTIDLQAAAYNAAASGLSIGQLANSNQTLQQEVTIHAEFPNVSDHNEIEEAFNNLVNRASQYANRY